MEATAAKPTRLGRGLNSLISDISADPTPAGPVSRVAVGRIQPNPYQPRKRFDDDELTSLTASVRAHGILQPITVRAVPDGFQLIAGERRLRAAKAAGLSEIPVHVVPFDDQQTFEASLVENIQRADLNPIEKAQGFKEYLDKYGLSQEQLGAKLGLDRTTISNLLGLLNLQGEVQDAVRLGSISLGHAKVLKGVTEPERQVALCRETLMKGHSVRMLEAIVKQQEAETGTLTEEPAEKKEPVEKTAHVKGVEDELRQRLAVRVEIKLKAKDKGQVVIGFESNDDFERILDALKK